MSFDFFLPLLTYPDPTPADGLLRAVDFAATLGGSLSIVTQAVDIPPISNPLAAAVINVSAMSAAAEERSRTTGEQLSQQVESLARRHALTFGAEPLVCRLEETASRLAQVARTHDGTLMAIDCGSDTHRGIAEGLLFGSGGPVVFFPATEAATHLETVVVAWDGGVAAARAVRDALPVLRQAKQVVIVTVREDKPIDSAGVEGLRALFSRHGIEAQHRDIGLEGKSIGEAMQSHALASDAGLLVMGAYGHNRLRELVLGGATRSTLANMHLPILMSH